MKNLITIGLPSKGRLREKAKIFFEESGLKILVDTVRLLQITLGDVRKDIYPEEIPIAKKLRYWENK